MSPKPTTVTDYLNNLSEDRRKQIEAVREVILANLPEGIEEGIQYGMIGYYIPLSIYPAGYHAKKGEPLPFIHLASQKNHMAIYLMSIYAAPGAETKFVDAYKSTGKRLDMGKACVRFKSLDDLPLEVIADTVSSLTVAEHIAHYEAATQRK